MTDVQFIYVNTMGSGGRRRTTAGGSLALCGEYLSNLIYLQNRSVRERGIAAW